MTVRAIARLDHQLAAVRGIVARGRDVGPRCTAAADRRGAEQTGQDGRVFQGLAVEVHLAEERLGTGKPRVEDEPRGVDEVPVERGGRPDDLGRGARVGGRDAQRDVVRVRLGREERHVAAVRGPVQVEGRALVALVDRRGFATGGRVGVEHVDGDDVARAPDRGNPRPVGRPRRELVAIAGHVVGVQRFVGAVGGRDPAVGLDHDEPRRAAAQGLGVPDHGEQAPQPGHADGDQGEHGHGQADATAPLGNHGLEDGNRLVHSLNVTPRARPRIPRASCAGGGPGIRGGGGCTRR